MSAPLELITHTYLPHNNFRTLVVKCDTHSRPCLTASRAAAVWRREAECSIVMLKVPLLKINKSLQHEFSGIRAAVEVLSRATLRHRERVNCLTSFWTIWELCCRLCVSQTLLGQRTKTHSRRKNRNMVTPGHTLRPCSHPAHEKIIVMTVNEFSS